MLNPEPDRPRSHRGDLGSTQILMPVGLLIVLLLGAIAFDLSWIYQAQRELTDTAASAANDAVTYGLSPGSLRDGSGGHLDSQRVANAVDRNLSVRNLSGLDPGRTNISINGDQVTVTLTRQVDYVFAKSIPGTSSGRDVTATMSATLQRR